MLLKLCASYRYLLLSLIIVWIIVIYILRDEDQFRRLKIDKTLSSYWPLGGTPKNATDLQRLCDRTEWIDGLWIHCHSKAKRDAEGKQAIHGGLNNARNRVQSCLRVAIDAGAGVVIPSVATRDQTRLKNLGGGEPIAASNFWNMGHMEKLSDHNALSSRYVLISKESRRNWKLHHGITNIHDTTIPLSAT
jgi:hypothetical protein